MWYLLIIVGENTGHWDLAWDIDSSVIFHLTPQLTGLFKMVLPHFFDVYVFGISFYITSGITK